MAHLPKDCQFSKDSKHGDTNTKVSQTYRTLSALECISTTTTAIPINS